MASPKLFWRLFLLSAGLQLATVLAFVVLVAQRQERQVLAVQRQRLRDTVTVLRGQLRRDAAGRPASELQPLMCHLADETGLRLTFVAMDGRVLADSQEEPAAMENHQGRLELMQAAHTGWGSSQRYSPTLKRPMLYYAARVDDAQHQAIGMIRVALPLAEVQVELRRMHRTLWLVAGGISLTGLLLTYVVVWRALEPVKTLTRAANAMAAGKYQQRVRVPGRDELGNLAQSFNRMVSEIEARENQLREVVERTSAVLASMVEGVIAVDDQQQVLFANEAAGRLLGFDPYRVQGKMLLEAVRNHRLQAVVAEKLQRPPATRYEPCEIQPAADSPRVLSVNLARLPGEPCPGVVLVMHDITELRRLEAMRQEFVANVSHELKTPLSAIMAYAETLREGALEDPDYSRRFLQQIEEQAGRLAELIQDMLQLARIEAGQVAHEITSVSLSQVVDACLKLHENAARSAQITLTAQQENPDLRVRADEEALRQILDNLVTNAIKYTAAGGQVRIAWHSRDRRAVISVADNGIGIAPEHQARIFERFYRVDKARSRDLGGTGLGLSIVKHLAQTLGGSVSVTSAPGQGSTFQVDLPAA